MAFFNNNIAYDSRLCRKRSSCSITIEQPSRSSTSISYNGSHITKLSASNFSNPSTDSIDLVPPLPLGTSRLTPIAVPAASTWCGILSTPLLSPSIKNHKPGSPPPFSNSVVYATHNYPAMDHVSSFSPVNTHPAVVPSKELPTRSSSLRRTITLEIKPPRIQTSFTEVERAPPPTLYSSEKPILPAVTTSSTREAHSHTNSLNINISLSSSPPVTPILFAPSPSPGHSPTSHSFSSGHNSSRSSFKRILLSPDNFMERLVPGLPSPVSVHMTRKAIPSSESPTQVAQGCQKRQRNVLKKHSPHGHPEAVLEDIDKVRSSMEHWDRNHRSRSKSVTISPTRSKVVFDISQPMPTNALNLTPAGEVVAVYQQLQRSFRDFDSGKLVPVGVPDCSEILRNPSSIPVTGGVIQDTQAHEGIHNVKNGLTRKFSAKLGKPGDKPEERFHTTSTSVAGLPDDLVLNPRNEPRLRPHASKPINTFISPRQQELKLFPEQAISNHEENRGRVWEDTVDDWVINRQYGLQTRVKEMEKSRSSDTDVSNPRRLWKLVKRLSSGNLRERKQPSTEGPPPVPPLPKNLTGRATDHKEDMSMLMTTSPIPEMPKGIMRYISSIPSLTIPEAHCVPVSTKWPPSQEVNPISSSPRSPTGAGPSRRLDTIRSSSPSSGATGFFSRSRSSSTSSYGETLPPVSDMPFAYTILKHGLQGVVTPAFSERNEQWHARSHSKSSPRQKSHDISPAGSATIPWFDIQNPVNRFLISKGQRTQYAPLVDFQSPNCGQIQLGRRPSTANASSSGPPPIPVRSLKRPSTSTSSMFGNSNSRKLSVPCVMHFQGPSLDDDQRSKSRPRSASDGVMESSPASVTFREMTRVKRPLTEAEKAAKWEDLLNRSAKAGGTLHVVPRTDSPNVWSE